MRIFSNFRETIAGFLILFACGAQAESCHLEARYALRGLQSVRGEISRFNLEEIDRDLKQAEEALARLDQNASKELCLSVAAESMSRVLKARFYLVETYGVMKELYDLDAIWNWLALIRDSKLD